MLICKHGIDDYGVVQDAFFNDAESMRFWNVPAGAKAYEWFAGKQVYAAEVDGAMAGFIAVQVGGHRAGIEFGVLPEYRNKGIASEMVTWIGNRLLDRDAIQRVWAVVDCENGASRRVMFNAGFTHEGICRKYLIAPNIGPEPRDVHFFAKVR